MHEDDDNVTTARGHARAAWLLFTGERNLRPRLVDWQTGTAPDGSPQVSARVDGPGGADALRRFTASHHLALGNPGDLRQSFDYTVPGRTACVWRSSGVWVELWHPDSPETAPAPVHAPSRPASAARWGLGGRLPYSRRRTETTA